MADITNRKISVPGVNAAANFVKQYAYMLDFTNLAEIAKTGTHKLVNLPAGEALMALKVVVIDKVTSGGAATVQFKVNGAAVTAAPVALAGLGDGFTHNLNISGIAAYGENTLQLTVGTADLTGGKLLVIADTIPAEMFVTNG